MFIMGIDNQSTWKKLVGFHPTGFAIDLRTAGIIVLVFGIPAGYFFARGVTVIGALFTTAGIAALALADTLLDLRDHRRKRGKRLHAVIICILCSLVLIICLIYAIKFIADPSLIPA